MYSNNKHTLFMKQDSLQVGVVQLIYVTCLKWVQIYEKYYNLIIRFKE